jgi:two-component system sensor kinase FixL
MIDPQRDRWITTVPWLYVVLHVTLDAASFVQPVLKLGITPWNPQAGLMLAFLCWRASGAGWVVAALCLSEFVVRGVPSDLAVFVAQVAAVTILYAVAASRLRHLEIDRTSITLANAVRFVAIAGVTSLIAGVSVVSLYLASDALDTQQWLPALSRYWVGDLNGILMLTPLLLQVGHTDRLLAVMKSDPVGIAAISATIAIALGVIFVVGNPNDLRFFYLLFVPAAWAALRWGVHGLLLTAVAIQIGLILGVRGVTGTAPLVDLQYLMVTLSLTGLALGTVVEARTRALAIATDREAEQRAMIDAVPDAVLSVADDGEARPLNAAAKLMFGIDDHSSAHRIERYLPELESRERAGRALIEAHSISGRRFPAEIAWALHGSGTSRRALIIVRDVSDRESAQSQLRIRDAGLARASRAAVAGELATALAHELNQPMTALVSYLRASQILVQENATTEPRLNPTLDKAAEEALRASAILRRLRDFYSGRGPSVEPTDTKALIQSALHSYERGSLIRSSMVSLLIDEDLPTIDVDRIHFEIVVHNLLSNAIEALRDTPAPRIEVTAMLRANRLVVRVDDNGPGISPELTGREFSAFMTTKPDGMGMGLAVSRSLMRAQGADLVVASGRLGGACFEIRFTVSATIMENR